MSPTLRSPWIALAAALAWFGSVVSAQTSSPGSNGPTAASAGGGHPRIVLVGDSTVTDHAGWGSGFKRFLTPEVECINTAVGGRSSKSFRDEGHWAKALALKGDYYLIQFGHNDEPGKGPERETDPATTFRENMARYVDEVRAQGGRPVLLTSLTRRNFDPADPTKLKSSQEGYVAATRAVAAEKKVPLIDLYARSVDLVLKLGPKGSAEFDEVKNGKPDTTHIEAKGSVVFARLVVDDARTLLPDLAPFFRHEPTAPVAPAAPVAAEPLERR